MGEARRRSYYRWSRELPKAFEEALEEKEVMWTLSIDNFKIRRGIFPRIDESSFWDFNASSYKKTRVIINIKTKRFEIYGVYLYNNKDAIYDFLKNQNMEFEFRNESDTSVPGIFLKNVADTIKAVEYLVEKSFN